ncbi:DNA polymerase III subunit delta [Pseudalkalibacillus berkeleyi]|uniref:DNA polymerase III subunit delta n=1 Tax=Pseudalkalibacillus berkeleyi TaxID=1069813 RepID=A0ABS9H2A4_9BACL|nr:DNA polymerase III subunit delta [Pseudalkalibacillus berkeleyi]MCF6137988.1 DNA polymerase III subunit delta [Pseudalkalibacillus berkeleyi]
MSIKELTKKLKSESYSSLYLLYGKEKYILEHTQKMIVQAVLDEGTADFNLSSYDMEEYTIQSALDDAETLPFMGDYRVVIIQNPYFLTGTKAKQKVEHDLKRLESYLSNPTDHAIVIFVAPYEKLDERKKVVKALKKHGDVIQAEKMNIQLQKEWVNHAAKEANVHITNEAAERLIQLQGENLAMLISEVNKMALNVGVNGVIEPETVDELISRSLESNVFTMVEHVANRRIDAALRICYDLLKQNEEPIKLMALLARQIRIILQVKQLGTQGFTEKKMASLLSLHPYAVKIAAKQGRSFSEKELKKLLIQAADADFEMKTGQRDKQLTLELFLTSVVREKQVN